MGDKRIQEGYVLNLKSSLGMKVSLERRMTVKNVLTFSERIELYDLLKKVCFKHKRTGGAMYKPGYDDERLATEAKATLNNHKIAKHHVSNLRQEMIGHLAKSGGGRQSKSAAVIEGFQGRLAALEDWAEKQGFVKNTVE